MMFRQGAAALMCLILAGNMTAALGGKENRTETAERKLYTGQIMERLLEPEFLQVEKDGELWRAEAGRDHNILVPEEFVRQALEIGVLEYPDSAIVLRQGDTQLKLGLEETVSVVPERNFGEERAKKIDGKLYLPLNVICEVFGYEVNLAPGSRKVHVKDTVLLRKRRLPASYDYRNVGRDTRVKDQGNYGTCWSFASLTALETALRPGNVTEFSADHMSLHNGFSLDQTEGGEYTMSMAYLLGWQGPVLEEEDPYGDGISPDGLEPAVHVQEIRILPPKDYEAIKKAVFFDGGVQSSLYTSITGSQSRSPYYNRETSAYCYQGDRIPNHDVVIVGWDDQYPKENFQTEVPGDGAFVCVSSWGSEFGEEGYFYVSYYDSNIGSSSLVYTGIENTDNYDYLYQSDLCGWVGQVGYGRNKAYGANVYQTREQELLKAVGFYATGENTSYRIFLSHHVGEEPEFDNRKLVAEGTVDYSGYYTIPLRIPQVLEPGERFAVILEAQTPGAVHPIAVEYRADDATAEADVTDGESYISLEGTAWERMEDEYQCNLCLKAYTDKA